MRPLRLSSLALLCALLFAPSALAARHVPTDVVQRAQSAHFTVWSEPTGDANPTDATVQRLLTDAEDARSRELALSFPAPKDDGDARTDIYIATVSGGHPAYTFSDAGPPSSAYIVMDPVTFSFDEVVIAHELFHVIQFGQARLPSWIAEGTAVWMTNYLKLTTPEPNGILRAQLDCGGDCSSDSSDAAGDSYSRAVFFDYLGAKYTPTIVRDLLDQLRLVGSTSARSGIAALDGALRGHGASLASAYADFAASGALTAQADAQTTLSSSHTSDSFPLTVASYATRIVQVAATCSDTTLSVSVSAGGSALAPKLVVAGATYELTAGLSGYSATVPWKSPCSTGAARLVVPNVGAGEASVTAQVALGAADAKTTAPTGQTPTPSQTQATTTPVATKTTAARPAVQPTLRVSLPRTVTVTVQRSRVTADVRVGARGTLLVELDGGRQAFAVGPGTKSIDVGVPIRSGPLRLRFTLVDAGGRTVAHANASTMLRLR